MAFVKIAVIQASFNPDCEKNISKMTEKIKEAAQNNAKIILLPELFENHYFPREKKKEFFDLAKSFKGNKTLFHFQGLCEKLKVAIPISFFEMEGEKYFNSIAFIDERGRNQGIYRKTFIPSGPGYEEKYYFNPGNSGFKVWETRFGKMGVGICWDQWFPEASRAMTQMGADLLLYPTCIGSEPEDPDFDTQKPWQRVIRGQAVANTIPIAAANRVGKEGDQTYYGSSFIADHRGNFLAKANREEETILYAELDFEKIREDRKDFGLLRDLSLSGQSF